MRRLPAALQGMRDQKLMTGKGNRIETQGDRGLRVIVTPPSKVEILYTNLYGNSAIIQLIIIVCVCTILIS